MSRLINEIEQVAENLFTADQQTLWRDEVNGFERRLLIPPSNQYKCEMIDGKLSPGAFIEYQKPPVQGLEHYLWLYEGELTITQNAESWSLKKVTACGFIYQDLPHSGLMTLWAHIIYWWYVNHDRISKA